MSDLEKEDELVFTFDTETFNQFVKFGTEQLARSEGAFPMNSNIEVTKVYFNEALGKWHVNVKYDEYSIN